jgi:hypothetical protein
MRYLAAVALGLVLVIPALVPGESGQMVNQYGNVDPPVPVTFYPPSDVGLPAGGPGIPPSRQHEAGGREGGS